MSSVLNTGLYSLSSRFFNILLALFTLAVLGRLVSVEDFGLFGIILILRSLLMPFIDFALEPSYIKLERADENASAAFFTLNFYISILATFLMICLSWVGELFFQEYALKLIVAVFSLTIFFSSLAGQPAAILKRKKRFDLVAKIEVLTAILSSISVCLLAFLGFGIWALVIRAIIESFFRTAMYISASSMPLKLVGIKEIKKYTESVKFAGQIVISRLPNRFLLTLDKILIGKFLDAEALGFYSRTQQLTQMTDTNLGKPISSPALSYLARINGGATANHYFLLMWVTFSLAGFSCLVLYITGEKVMPLLMGEQWVGAGVILELMGLWGIGKLFHTLGVLYHINEKKMQRWFYFMIAGIPIIYIVPLFAIMQGVGIKIFVTEFSIAYMVYWIVVFFGCLLMDSGNVKNVVITFGKLGLIVTGTIYMGKVSDIWLSDFVFSSTVYLVTQISLMLVVYIMTFLIVGKKQKIEILKILSKY